MSPSDADVLATFRARVNMSADELAAWLDDPESAHAGTGVGLDSGRRILAILRKNPKGDPKGYDEEDVKHMRKVVAYLARHLAQEGHLKATKTTDELAHTRSTISLRNWGHDPVKAKTQEEGGTDETKEDDDDGESTTADEPSPSGADEKGESVDADADADAAKPATRSQDQRKSARGDKAGASAGSKRKRGHADDVAGDRGSGGGNDEDEDVEDADEDADADADYDVDDGKGDEEDSSGEDAEDGPRPAVQRKTEAGAESIDEEPEA